MQASAGGDWSVRLSVICLLDFFGSFLIKQERTDDE
jgi:hypothetical protein